MHIGPPKTGTTAIQGALHQARPQLAEYGVVYAGAERHPYRAALAVAGKRDRHGNPRAVIEHWHQLVADVRAGGDHRVVISSEFFSEADDAAARRVVDELGGPRVHVVVTLRPLAKILPSAWQQYVRNRLRTPYSRWLNGVFNSAPEVASKSSFWMRHSHDVLVARWAGIVGPEHVTVVMADDSDRLHLTRTFEQLTGLPEGLLVPDSGSENRSLTHGETELIRRLNAEFYRRRWSDAAYRDIVRHGLVPALQARKPGRAEPRTVTPAWALERAAERGAAAARNIAALGVRVVGDIDGLGAARAPAGTKNAAGVIPSAAGADGLVGAIVAAAQGVPELIGDDADGVDRRSVGTIRAGELIRIIGGRARERVGRGISRRREKRSARS